MWASNLLAVGDRGTVGALIYHRKSLIGKDFVKLDKGLQASPDCRREAQSTIQSDSQLSTRIVDTPKQTAKEGWLAAPDRSVVYHCGPFVFGVLAKKDLWRAHKFCLSAASNPGPEKISCDWQGKIKNIFDLAGISKGLGNAISHRFRDTFAVELLLAGVPIERVSVLLGHQSVRVTEKHYNPWVRSRQEQLEADVRNAWKSDPLIIAGTNQVQIAKGPVN
jgi:Phage integrase family